VRAGRAPSSRIGVGLLLLALAGCAGRPLPQQSTPAPSPPPQDEAEARGVRHLVQPGQTLWRIARVYGVPLEEIAAANGIEDPTRLNVGQRLLIPGARRVLDVPPAPQPLAGVTGPSPPPRTPPPKAGAGGWGWPLDGPLSSSFGARRRHGRHHGIDISAPPGTPVHASRAGRVTFAGDRGAYGRLVVISHPGGFSSWYGHNSSLRVRVGEQVRKGQVIARSGRTGNASGPHLHFEIRRQGRALDPLTLLP